MSCGRTGYIRATGAAAPQDLRRAAYQCHIVRRMDNSNSSNRQYTAVVQAWCFVCMLLSSFRCLLLEPQAAWAHVCSGERGWSGALKKRVSVISVSVIRHRPVCLGSAQQLTTHSQQHQRQRLQQRCNGAFYRPCSNSSRGTHVQGMSIALNHTAFAHLNSQVQHLLLLLMNTMPCR